MAKKRKKKSTAGCKRVRVGAHVKTICRNAKGRIVSPGSSGKGKRKAAKGCKFGKVKSGPRKGKCRLKRTRGLKRYASGAFGTGAYG